MPAASCDLYAASGDFVLRVPPCHNATAAVVGAPQDFGVSLRRITEHQIEYKRLWYNEIIIDAKHWRSHLSDQVEAIFNNPENHRRFLAAFPHLTPETHPHVLLDATNWHSPFSMDHPDGDG